MIQGLFMLSFEAFNSFSSILPLQSHTHELIYLRIPIFATQVYNLIFIVNFWYFSPYSFSVIKLAINEDFKFIFVEKFKGKAWDLL